MLLVVDDAGRLAGARSGWIDDGHQVVVCDVGSRLWRALNGLRFDYVIIHDDALAAEKTLLGEPVVRASHVVVTASASMAAAIVCEASRVVAREDRRCLRRGYRDAARARRPPRTGSDR